MYLVAMSDKLIPSKYTISEGVCWAEIQAAVAVRGSEVVVASVTRIGRCSWQHLQGTLNLGRHLPKPTALANSAKLIAQQPRRPNTTDDVVIHFQVTINAISNPTANESKDNSRKGSILLYSTKKQKQGHPYL